MKIHIIGCSGSGKTYFAKALSNKYNIPHFDLDDIQWDNNSESYGVKMPVEKRDALLKEILEKKDWIIEGVYYSWVLESFEKADIIYVLDIPKHIYKNRISKRLDLIFDLNQIPSINFLFDSILRLVSFISLLACCFSCFMLL